MKSSEITSPWARFAFIALSFIWAASGWGVLLHGGFHVQTAKYTSNTTFVDGLGAVFMAYVFLCLAVVAASVVLQSLKANKLAYVIVLLLGLGAPCIFLLQI